MKIYQGTVWHTYTLQCPETNFTSSLIERVMLTRMCLSAFDSSYNFYFFDNDKLRVNPINLDFNPEVTGVKANGFPTDSTYHICDFTRYSINLIMNRLLSQAKMLQADGTFYGEFVFFALKPIFINHFDEDKILLPCINVYSVGIAQVNFIDIADYSDQLDDFINKRVNFHYARPKSIITSLDFALHYWSHDKMMSPLYQRVLLRRQFSTLKEKVIANAESIDVGGIVPGGLYTDYVKVTGVSHGLSDIARTLIAMIYTRSKKTGLREFFSGIDASQYYSAWHGKPNIYILRHENQKAKSTLNCSSNPRVISALLTKNAEFFTDGKPFEHRDYRYFDDFNYFSEQGVSLSLLSRKAMRSIENNESYTIDNFKWDSLVKSDLRELVSFFYEKMIYKINSMHSNSELANIKSEIFQFEEWLRHSSKRSGEIQNYALSLLEGKDIKQSRSSIEGLIKSRMEVIKIKESEVSDKTNNNLTMIFGLIATTSLSPIFIKPFFEYFNLDKSIKDSVLKNFEDAIYFILASVIVYIAITILNRKK